MRKLLVCLSLAMLLRPVTGKAETLVCWRILSYEGEVLTEICEQPSIGDEYITSDNQLYEIKEINGYDAIADSCGSIDLPNVEWLDSDAAHPVMSMRKSIAIYCTHSDESYAPSDGYYTTTQRGSIYQIAHSLADSLQEKGVDAVMSDNLHHPHDAGAYRRSRQTAVQLIKNNLPDCLIDIHRDGIPDPVSYEATIGGEAASKIRLLVGRGNQNAEVNKEFALLIKAVADKVYPGLIKDIYMGKGTFNQDLLPQSILFECGTYTLDKERVLRSMPMMADVLNRALYGGIVGSAGRLTSDVDDIPQNTAGITMGEPDANPTEKKSGLGSGFGFLGILLVIGIAGFAILSTGSLKRGMHKAGRNLNEMTGGLIGKKPDKDEEPNRS